MTTNKPPIAAWAPSSALAKLASRHNNAPCVLTDGPAEFNDVALVRLADYQRLQAECEEELFCVRQDRDTHFGEMMRAIEQVDAMKAECEKLRKDAERYRWMCDGNGYFLEHEMLCGFENEKAEADAAIDAAMEGDKP